jgi:hypothetical protein
MGVNLCIPVWGVSWSLSDLIIFNLPDIIVEACLDHEIDLIIIFDIKLNSLYLIF